MELPTVWSGTFPGHSAGYSSLPTNPWLARGGHAAGRGGDKMVDAPAGPGTATIDRESWPRSAVGGYIGPGPCSLGGASTAYINLRV
jgi:hypothetical protein